MFFFSVPIWTLWCMLVLGFCFVGGLVNVYLSWNICASVLKRKHHLCQFFISSNLIEMHACVIVLKIWYDWQSKWNPSLLNATSHQNQFWFWIYRLCYVGVGDAFFIWFYDSHICRHVYAHPHLHTHPHPLYLCGMSSSLSLSLLCTTCIGNGILLY